MSRWRWATQRCPYAYGVWFVQALAGRVTERFHIRARHRREERSRDIRACVFGPTDRHESGSAGSLGHDTDNAVRRVEGAECGRSFDVGRAFGACFVPKMYYATMVAILVTVNARLAYQ